MSAHRPARHAGPTLGLAALLALGAPLPAQGQDQILGRLFLTPEQRQALDEQRYAAPAEPEEEPPEPEAPAEPETVQVPPPPPVKALTMEGLVVRERGPNTAWVDGNAVLRRGSAGEGVSVDPTGAREGGVSVTVRGVEGPVSLKPGQRFDPATSRVMEFRTPPRKGQEDGEAPAAPAEAAPPAPGPADPPEAQTSAAPPAGEDRPRRGGQQDAAAAGGAEVRPPRRPGGGP